MQTIEPKHEYREERRERIATRRGERERDARIEFVIAFAAREFNTTAEVMRSGVRIKRRNVVTARELAVMVLRFAGFSMPQIARQLGFLDHTAVFRIVERVEGDGRFSPYRIGDIWREACGKVKAASV